MFKNLFDLKLYYSDVNCIDNGCEITDVNEYLKSHYQTKLLPVINYKSREFIIGDLFINKRTKSIYIFSFLTDKNIKGIKKIGFYYMKDYHTLLKTNNIDVFNFIDLNMDCGYGDFDFFTLNGIKNLDELINIGNILLMDELTISSDFISFYEEKIFDIEAGYILFKNLKSIIRKSDDITISIKENNPSRYNYNGYNSYYIGSLNPRIIFEENFKFSPSIYIEDKISKIGFAGDYNQIAILRDINIKKENINVNTKYMIFFDKEIFESKILLESNNEKVNYDYILNYSSKYKELKEEDNKEYLEELLYFL